MTDSRANALPRVNVTATTTSALPTPAPDLPAVLIDYLAMRPVWSVPLCLPREDRVTDLPGPQLAVFMNKLRQYGVADADPDSHSQTRRCNTPLWANKQATHTGRPQSSTAIFDLPPWTIRLLS